jgi:2-oxoglutarate dehydrogenase E2 component (dihydrolipoamide succinyltransferase)
MKHEIQVPEVGESVSGGILATWFKSSGDQIAEGEEIFELETDKATLAVPAPASGVLSIEIAEDNEVEVGQTVAYVETEAAAGGGAPSAEQPAGQQPAAEQPAGQQSAGAESREQDTGKEEQSPAAAYARLSPAARRVVDENDLDPREIRGTGKDGRITKDDAVKAAEKQHSAQSQAGTSGQASESAQPAAGQQTQAQSKDSGAAAAPTSGAAQQTGQQGQRAPQAQAAGSESGERQTRKKMSTLRKRIAENMVRSKQDSAHLTTFNEVDMSAVSEIRKSYKDSFEEKHGIKLGFMSFFIKAACRALQTFPEVNAFIDGDEIVYNNYYNVGVALSSDRGLIVPVLRDADTKSFAEIEGEIADFISRAQQKRLAPDELTGGTFTISNGGVFGSMLSTPIPNPPQTAVLGMHAIQKRPVAVNDEVVIRPMMYLALTYDHRIIDGREAVRFLVKIKNLVEDPTQLLLDL